MHAHIAVKTERRAGSPPDARVMRKVADRDACESHTWQTHDQIELAKEHTLEDHHSRRVRHCRKLGMRVASSRLKGYAASLGGECLLAMVSTKA